MAQAIAMIKDINPTAKNLTLQVRVVRLWTMASFKNSEDVYSIDMGDKIQATIKKSLLRTFQPLLKEGEIYTISNYRVGKNSGEYKPTGHPYKINFVILTRVNVLHAANIPTYGFDLVPFDAIIPNGLDSTCLVDVIGYLSGVTSSDDYMRNGIYTKQLTIHFGKGGKTSSEMVTQLSSHTSQKNETEFLKKSERKHVDKIRETQEARD
ncbi:replication factor A protein 1-like [Spinacia oleracea]|uniref:Replication factor A protein 1-like n=1 Tax=Spinacia oleracea TaxID=3562 RepID=A0ABM3R828_SPIOL|nr:replication factor A protein 1-like [Spinacia oleracea]